MTVHQFQNNPSLPPLSALSTIVLFVRGESTLIPAVLSNLTLNGTPFGTGATPASPGALSSTSAFHYLTISNITATQDWEIDGLASLSRDDSFPAQAPRFEIQFTNVPIAVQLGQPDFPVIIYNYPLVTTSLVLKGDVIDLNQLVFDQSVDGPFAGNISGLGSVTKAGSGTVD